MVKQVIKICDEEALALTDALLDFALAEFCSGIEMLQAAKRTDNSKLAAGFMCHAIDEYRHTYLFHKISESVAERYTLRGLSRYLPVHSYKKRYLDCRSFLFEKKSPDRFSVFVAISEKHAATHFVSVIEKNIFLNAEEKRVLDDILKDEKRHILFAEQAVAKFKAYKPFTHLWYSILEKKDLVQRNVNQRFESVNTIIARAMLHASSVVLRLLILSIENKVSPNKSYSDLKSALSQNADMY